MSAGVRKVVEAWLWVGFVAAVSMAAAEGRWVRVLVALAILAVILFGMAAIFTTEPEPPGDE